MESEKVIFAEPGAAEPPPVTVDGLILGALRNLWADKAGLLIYAVPLIALWTLNGYLAVPEISGPVADLVVFVSVCAGFFWLRRLQLGRGAEWQAPYPGGKSSFRSLPLFGFLFAVAGYVLCLIVLCILIGLAALAAAGVMMSLENFAPMNLNLSIRFVEGRLVTNLVSLPVLVMSIFLTARCLSMLSDRALSRVERNRMVRRPTIGTRAWLPLGIAVVAIMMPWLLFSAARAEGLFLGVMTSDTGLFALALLEAELSVATMLTLLLCIDSVFGWRTHGGEER
jgi:hypothetical protein